MAHRLPPEVLVEDPPPVEVDDDPPPVEVDELPPPVEVDELPPPVEVDDDPPPVEPLLDEVLDELLDEVLLDEVLPPELEVLVLDEVLLEVLEDEPVSPSLSVQAMKRSSAPDAVRGRMTELGRLSDKIMRHATSNLGASDKFARSDTTQAVGSHDPDIGVRIYRGSQCPELLASVPAQLTTNSA